LSRDVHSTIYLEGRQGPAALNKSV
jgi:hypothetical protein